MIRNARAQLDLNTNISPICIMYTFAFEFSRSKPFATFDQQSLNFKAHKDANHELLKKIKDKPDNAKI